MDINQISYFRTLILECLTRLRAYEDEGNDDAAPVELDQSRVGRLSRQDALQSQALATASQQRRRDEIDRLRAALSRIEEGEFGYCEECGRKIAPGRLEADPAADHCVACAATAERRAR